MPSTASPNTAKIVFIGAGSQWFGLSMFRDILSADEMRGSTLTLVDTNAAALERMAGLAHRLNAHHGNHVRIEHTTERRAALDGADFVLSSVAIDRNRLWRLDFEIPKKHGIRHTLGENGGPGGLFFTMRTLPLVFDIVRDVEAICPKALFINFSNPESRIILALGKYSPVRAIGQCHGILMAREDMARILGRKPEELDVWAAGLNHFQCVTDVRDPVTGEDFYPALREAERGFDPGFRPLTRRLFQAFGRWLTCSDDHMGEYVAYGYEGGEHGYDYDWDNRNRAELQGIIDTILAGGPFPDWMLTPSGESAAALMGGMLHNRRRVIPSAIVYNQGAIPNLPADLAVEVPVVADAAGIHPVSMGPLPDPIAKLMTMQANVQQLAVEAAVHASKELALQALLIDPVVNSTTAAVALLDELWEVNRPYIRGCV